MNEERYEIVKFVDNEFELDVNVNIDEETIWLNQKEISQLFEVDVSRVSRHINAIFKDDEVDKRSNLRKKQIPFSDKKVTYYSLDLILAIGYRVNSKRGILFRKWANSILKQYLINGYSFNEKRCLACQDNIIELKEKVNQIENKVLNEDEIFKEKIFYEDQIYDGYSFIKKLMLEAKKEIVIIDGYIDISVLDMLNDIDVDINIYTLPSMKLSNQDISKFKIKHNVNIIIDTKYHDRFLIIDDDVYLLGSSIKDIGKKRSVITKLNTITKDIVIKVK